MTTTTSAQVPCQVELRAATPGDRAHLLAVYGSTRAEELAPLGWSDEQQAAFVESQFSAQDSYYRAYHRTATFDVVLADGQPAGRLYVDRWAEEIRVVDVTLLPSWRGRGIGTRLLRELMGESADGHRRLSVHVEVVNPARRLYERLGFRVVADRGLHLLMEWAGSGDDGLVAHALVVRAERHDEQRDLADVRVRQGEDLLIDEPSVGRVEVELEGHPSVPALPFVRGAEPRLLAARQDEVERLAVLGAGTEHLPDERGERGAGHLLEHWPDTTHTSDDPAMVPARTRVGGPT
jgi:ribosomal protein S18 acetylase RimI-like enzyme